MVCRRVEAGEEGGKSIFCDRLPGLLGNHFGVRLSLATYPRKQVEYIVRERSHRGACLAKLFKKECFQYRVWKYNSIGKYQRNDLRD